MRARIVFLVRVPAERREDFLAAYERIRYQVSGGVPGHLGDQVCQSATDPEQWLITSEWRRLADFLAWEAGEEHRELVRPMRECMTEARSLRFLIRAETVATAETTATATATATVETTETTETTETEAGAPVGEEASSREEAPSKEGASSGDETSSEGKAGISPEVEVEPAAAAVARGPA